MFDIEIREKKGFQVIDSKLLYKELQVKSYHADWIRRRIENYEFEKDIDYFLDQFSTVRGGSKRKVYLLTLDMAKELAMIENNHTGKKVRKYFIEIEKEYHKQKLAIETTRHIRKSLTDAVQESGENERMHGKGYSNFTRLVYSFTGLTEKKKNYGNKDGFRETLSPKELKRVERVEAMIKPLLEMDKQYSEIKDTLKPIFEKKEIR